MQHELAEDKDTRTHEELLKDLAKIKHRVLGLAPPHGNDVPLFNAVDVHSLIGIAERLLRGL